MEHTTWYQYKGFVLSKQKMVHIYEQGIVQYVHVYHQLQSEIQAYSRWTFNLLKEERAQFWSVL